MTAMEVPLNIAVPDGIELRASAVDPSVVGTWAVAAISKGTVFGPFIGEILTEYDEKNCNYRFAWEVFDLDTKEVLHAVNATDATKGNWMRYMNCARYLEEQNFVSVQDNEKIYYKAIKDIKEGEELLIWYEPFKKRKRRKKRSVSTTSTGTPKKSPRKESSELSSISQHSNNSEDVSFDGDAESPEMAEDTLDRSKRQRKKKKLFDEQFLMTDLIFKKKRKRRTKEEMEKAKQNEVLVPLEPGRKRRKRRRRNSKGELVDPTLPEPAVVKQQELPTVERQNTFVEEFNPEEISIMEKEWTYPAKHLEYIFEPSAHFGIFQNGRKVFKCDVCSGIYKHTFSLKRHYLRNHINCKYLSKTDLANCLIQVGQQMLAMKRVNSSEILEKVTESLKIPASEPKSSTLQASNVIHSCENSSGKTEMESKCYEKNFENKVSTNEIDELKTTCNSLEGKKLEIVFPVLKDGTVIKRPKFIGKRYGLFKCSICFKLFDDLDILKSHTKDHPPSEDEKGFACDKCQMQFPYKQNLVRHQLVHDAEDKSQIVKVKKGDPLQRKSSDFKSTDSCTKPFKCPDCPLKFRFSVNLEKHQAIHLGNCPHTCSQCDKVFPTLTNLKKHQHFHTGKRVPCKHCTAIFVHVGSLRKHIRLEHPDIHCQRLLRLLEKRGKLSAKAAKALEECSEKDKLQASNLRKVGRKRKEKHSRLENQPKQKTVESTFSYPCVVCKKRFQSYVNMCRHRRLAHRNAFEKKAIMPQPDPEPAPIEIEKPKPKLSRLKMLTEPFIKREEKELVFETASDPIDNSPETIAAFYAKVASNIADNLSNYLDGGEIALSDCKTYIRLENISEEPKATDENIYDKLAWERYNFPLNYDPIVLDYNFIDLEEQQARMVKDEKNELRSVFDDGIPYVDKAPAQCTRRRSSLDGISSTESSHDGLELYSPRKKENHVERNESKMPGCLLARVCENLFKKIKSIPDKTTEKTVECVNTNVSGILPNTGQETDKPICDIDNAEEFKTSTNMSDKFVDSNAILTKTDEKSDKVTIKEIVDKNSQANTKEETKNSLSTALVLKLPLIFNKNNTSSNDKVITSKSDEPENETTENVDNSEDGANNCITLSESNMDTVTTVIGEDCLTLLENLETISDNSSSSKKTEATVSKDKITHKEEGQNDERPNSPNIYDKMDVADLCSSVSSSLSNKYLKKNGDSDEDDSECEIEFYDITSVMEASMAKSGYDDSPESINDQNSVGDDKEIEDNISPDQTSGIGSKEEEEEEDDNVSGYSSEGVYNPPLSDSDSDFEEHLNPGIPVGLLFHQLCLSKGAKKSEKKTNAFSVFNQPDAEKVYRNLLNNSNLKAKRSPNYNPYENYETISFGKHGPIAYVCTVCRKNFPDHDLLSRHQWKKHTSVACGYMQIEKGHDIEYLYFPEPSYKGLLGASGRALERISERTNYTCTRCSGSFKNVDRLRIHIINCAPDAIPSPSKSPKKKRLRKFPRKFMDSEHDLSGSPEFTEHYKTADKQSIIANQKIKLKKNIFDTEVKKKPQTPPPVVEEEISGKVRRKRSTDIGYNPNNHVRRREMTELLDRHQCRGCGVKFKSISLLERHVRKCDEKEKFKDLKVMKSTINESFHKKQKQLCFYCSKEFAYPKILMNHFRAFCNVKKEKEVSGSLTQEEKQKEIEMIKILKQQDQDRNEIVPHDLERENNGPKKGWPKGLKRKSRRKTHSWTSVKKRKSEEISGKTDSNGESPKKSSSENGISDAISEKHIEQGADSLTSNVHTGNKKSSKKRKVGIMQALQHKKKDLLKGSTRSDSSQSTGQQKVLKLTPVKKPNKTSNIVGPPEIMTVAKAVSVAASGIKTGKESADLIIGNSSLKPVVKRLQNIIVANNSEKIVYTSLSNTVDKEDKSCVSRGKNKALSPKSKTNLAKNSTSTGKKKFDEMKSVSANCTKHLLEENLGNECRTAEDIKNSDHSSKNVCTDTFKSSQKNRNGKKLMNKAIDFDPDNTDKGETQVSEKNNAGLQALLDVVTLEGYKSNSIPINCDNTKAESSNSNKTKHSKSAGTVTQALKGKVPKGSDKNSPLMEQESTQCVQAVCNVPKVVFNSEDVKDGLAPLNNLLQLAQVAADVLQGVVSKVEENDDVIYSTVPHTPHKGPRGIFKPANEKNKNDKSVNNNAMNMAFPETEDVKTGKFACLKKKRVTKSPVCLPSTDEADNTDESKRLNLTYDISDSL